MNENLDLTKILNGCPIGTEFYSSVFGKILFMGIDKNNSIYPILVKVSFGTNTLKQFTKQGKCYVTGGECILFPDKNQRDWSKFKRFWDKPKIKKFDPNTLQPFDKVLARVGKYNDWFAVFFSHIDDSIGRVCCSGYSWKQCIPYNDETKHLVGTRNDCSEYYKWWEDK